MQGTPKKTITMSKTSKKNATYSISERLSKALCAASNAAKESERKNIGVMKEKTLHSVMKFFYEPDSAYHEVKSENFVFDIFKDNTVIEIQTGSFRPIAKKIKETLENNYKIIVVRPIDGIKYISWISGDGTVSEPRKSPKKENIFSLLPELYYLGEAVYHENFTLRIVACVMLEYRLADGWSKDGKKGSHRENKIPKEILYSVDISTKLDYNMLLPDELPDIFTAKEFSVLTSLKRRRLSMALSFLKNISLIEQCGKKGNAFLYRKLPEKAQNNVL